MRADARHLVEVGEDSRTELEPTVATAITEEHGVDGSHTEVVIDLRSGIPVEVIDHVGEGNYASAPRWKMGVKRLIDIVVSTIALVLLLPVMAMVSLAIVTTSRGPVFFVQDRVGRNGRIFSFRKFRSMRAGAEDEKSQLWDLNEQDGPIFKIRQDPRVTRVGRFLRRYSLDELPQLIHVLTGQMSLVGPRPQLPEEVAGYPSAARRRLVAKPGVTCIWQVSGRSDLDFETWINLDLDYIDRWSLWLDLKLLAKTIPAVFSGKGAY